MCAQRLTADQKSVLPYPLRPGQAIIKQHWHKQKKNTIMTTIKSLCVYCGSRPGASPAWRRLAAELGKMLAQNGIRLVYGGGGIGLMGIVARAALRAGGAVTGVIPHHLDSIEVTLAGLTELHVVASMHERKHKMFALSDAFLTLPGGIGTLDETVEIITWRQLGLHDKPVVILDHDGYWAPFGALIEHMIAAGFAGSETTGLYCVVDRLEQILPALRAARPPGRPDSADLL